MKRLLVIAACIVILISACASLNTDTTHANIPATSVCTETGLTGAALQENMLFCSTNKVTGAVMNCCPSVYRQVIDLARKKNIVVGTPMGDTTTVDWHGVTITYVYFTSGYYAWHHNDGSGIVVIDDPRGPNGFTQVYP